MKILGIETSCDETACAVVEDGIRVISNVVASSAALHAKTGGIIPENAARKQIELIVPVIQESLAKSIPTTDYRNIKKAEDRSQKAVDKIDAIAVTVGPGLIGSLLVGVETAKTLSYLWKKPIIPVNHLVAHVYANWLAPEPLPEFPLLALVVSGGHTDLVLMKNHAAPTTLARSAGGRGNLKLIGGTRDDAAGEAFDKCARLLGLPYPGGPAIALESKKYEVGSRKYGLNMFPRPMINKNNFDFSFSGLKTSVLNKVKSNPTSPRLRRAELAAQVQEAIVDVLVTKSQKAVKKYKPKSFLLSGGVAANARLRKKLEKAVGNRVKLFIPDTIYCTDNAAIIASAAYFNNKPVPFKNIVANPQLTILDG